MGIFGAILPAGGGRFVIPTKVAPLPSSSSRMSWITRPTPVTVSRQRGRTSIATLRSALTART
jgi:hypothetical protein